MHCYPHFLGRKIPGTNTGVLFIYIWFQKNYGHANMYLSCTKYSCTVTHSFQVERFLPPVLAYYIWFQTRLLIFRQILVMHSIHMKCDLFFQAERVLPPILAYLFIYIYGTKRIMEMPICTSHVLNTHALLSAGFRQTDSCHP